MPYTNMPKDPKLQARMERCVKDVMAKGRPKKNAIAICYASLMGKKGEEKKDTEDEFVLDPAVLDPALILQGMDVEEIEIEKETPPEGRKDLGEGESEDDSEDKAAMTADQRAAMFAGMRESGKYDPKRAEAHAKPNKGEGGESPIAKFDGKPVRKDIEVRSYDAASGQFKPKKIPATVFGDYAIHRSANPSTGEYDAKTFTLTHVPTGGSVLPYIQSSKDAENIARYLYGSKVEIPTKMINGRAEPDSSNPRYEAAIKKYRAILDVAGVAGKSLEGSMFDVGEATFPEEEKSLRIWVKNQFDSLRDALGLKQAAVEDELADDEELCPDCKAKKKKNAPCPDCGKKELADGAMLYKDAATGAYRWLAVFSNKYRDRDNPPEIIASEAHKDFVRAVNAGEWPMPEYRLWHIAAPIGRADFMAYHDAGFSVASGTLNKGMDRLAEMMLAAPYRWANSHGMPVSEIRRDDPADKSIITRYRSKEITALPEWAAANELTLNFVGGDEMAGFTDKDRERLRQMFPDKADEVEKLLTEVGEKAEAAGVQSKEATPAPEANKDEAPAAQTDASAAPPTRQEVADVLTPLAEAVRSLAEKLDALSGEVKALKEGPERKDKESLVEALSRTPAVSLAELITKSITRGGPSEAMLKGRTPNDLKGPEETPTQQAPLRGAAQIPFIAQMIGAAQTPAEPQ